MKLEMGQQEGNAGFRHGHLLSREMLGKLSRDRREKRGKALVGGRCDVGEHALERGVIAVQQRDAENGSHLPSNSKRALADGGRRNVPLGRVTNGFRMPAAAMSLTSVKDFCAAEGLFRSLGEGGEPGDVADRHAVAFDRDAERREPAERARQAFGLHAEAARQ